MLLLFRRSVAIAFDEFAKAVRETSILKRVPITRGKNYRIRRNCKMFQLLSFRKFKCIVPCFLIFAFTSFMRSHFTGGKK